MDELRRKFEIEEAARKWKKYALDNNVPFAKNDYHCPSCGNEDVENYEMLGMYDYKEFNRDYWGHEWIQVAKCPECKAVFQYKESDI